MDWEDVRFVLITVLLVILHVHTVWSQSQCHPSIADCPNPLQTGIVSSPSQSKINIGGLFSNSRFDYTKDTATPFCSRCNTPPASIPITHRFAVEQAEALLHAIELISKYDNQGDLGHLGYRIMDTCGYDDIAKDCLAGQVGEYRRIDKLIVVLATIVGPFYELFSQSMSKSEFVSLSQDLIAPTLQSSGGVLSLLDLPFWYTTEVVEGIDDTSKGMQFLMLQQTCQLQALAAVDFLAQEGWGNVTVVASGDSCGAESLLEVYNHIERRKLGCHFNVREVNY